MKTSFFAALSGTLLWCAFNTTSSAQSLYSNTFDDAASIAGWTPVADATNSAEAALDWNAEGAMSLTGVNSADDAGRAYIFQIVDGAFDYQGATSVTLTFDLKTVGDLVGTAVHLQTEFPGPGTVNTFDLQTQGLNSAGYTSYSYTFDNLTAGSLFRMSFNLASGAFSGAGGTLLVDNLALASNGGGDSGDGGGSDPVATAPTDNAAAPTRDAADVISVYGGAYTSIATNLNPGWGQSGTVDANYDPGTGDAVLQYANFNYQGTDVAATDASAMTHLHLDVWVAEGTDRLLKVTPINPGDGTVETLVNVPLTPGSWSSVDLAKADFTGMTWTNIIQMKFDGQFNGDGSANSAGWDVYIDNLYFYNDGSGDTGGGDSGDGGGTDPVASAPTDNAPAPTADAADVISVYSDAYTDIATNYDPGWGQSGHTLVNPSYDPGTGNLVLAYPNLNYQGTDLTPTDASSMTHLHVDVWVAEGTDRQLKVTPVNSGDGAGEFLVNVPLTPGSWSSVNLAKADFTGMTWTNLIQMKFDGQFNGDGSANTTGYDVYIDNLYFYDDGSNDPVAVEGCMDADASNYNADATSDNGSCQYNVTFQVDMSQAGLVSGDVVNVNGSFNGWCGDCNPLTDAGNGLWTATLPLAPGVHEFKYTINGWAAQEELTVGSACDYNPTDGFANRGFEITDAPITLDAVCYNSCSACTSDIEGCMDDTAANYNADATVDNGSCTYNVTFRVDMANFDGAPFGVVNVNGTFNGWCGDCNPLSDDNADGVWEVILPLPAGTIEYKFTLDGWTQQEEFQPGGSCTLTTDGFTNRVLTIDGVEDLDVVCYNTCAACLQNPGCMDTGAANYDATAQVDDGSCLFAVTFQVDLSNRGLADGDIVYVNGTYNGWCGPCNALTDAGNGLWTGTFNVPGGAQEYKFTINGWSDQEYFNGAESCTTDPAEFVNRVVNVTAATTLPAVCWNTCDACADITNLTAGTGHTGIQAAIDAASAGDVIQIQDGSYAVDAPIAVNKAITLQGQSEAGVMLECGAALGGANSIQVTAGATLKDFTLNANSFATFGIHVQPGTDNTLLSGLTITNTASNGIGLSGVTNATVSDIAGSGNVQYVLGIAGSVGVTASDISGGNVGVYKGTGTYAQSATDIEFTGTFDLSGGFIIEQLDGADEITYSIDGSAADVKVPAAFDRVFFANYTSLPLPPPYNEASLATLVEADNLATVLGTAVATEQLGFFTLNDVAVYNLTADQWEVSAGLTIQDAIDRASAGDVIDIAAGTYPEALSLSQGATLNGNGSTLDVSGLGVGISIQSDVDGVTIDNLAIVGDASTYSGITVNPGASNVSLTNNDISGMALANPGNSSPLSYGILCWGNADPINPPSNILIDGNEIHGVAGTAISLGDNTEGVTISNNHFHDIAQVIVNGAPYSSGVVAGQANNLAISGNDMEGLAYASVLTACTGVTLDQNQYTGGTSLMLLASLPNSILPDASDWWSVEAAAIGYIYYFNSAAAQAATDAGLQAVGVPTTLSSSNPGCTDDAGCNYDSTALSDDGSCTYPAHPNFDCNGNCNNDADGDGICDELEGLIPNLESACGIGTMWDAELGQCVFNVECAGDINLDGLINSGDLLLMLANFGTYCPGNGPE